MFSYYHPKLILLYPQHSWIIYFKQHPNSLLYRWCNFSSQDTNFLRYSHTVSMFSPLYMQQRKLTLLLENPLLDFFFFFRKLKLKIMIDVSSTWSPICMGRLLHYYGGLWHLNLYSSFSFCFAFPFCYLSPQNNTFYMFY